MSKPCDNCKYLALVQEDGGHQCMSSYCRPYCTNPNYIWCAKAMADGSCQYWEESDGTKPKVLNSPSLMDCFTYILSSLKRHLK